MRTTTIPPALASRALADQVATLYRSWRQTTTSMLLGALILWIVLRDQIPVAAMVAWVAAIVANQAWRGLVAAAYWRTRPDAAAASRWGWRWAVGSTLAGSLWGVAAVAFYPQSPAHQALLIVCLFGVVLGGLNLTAVYKPSFYGFVLTALLPLIVRVGTGADPVHLSIAIVLSVVLAFVLAFGHQVNTLIARALAIRHENTDLIAELKARSEDADRARRRAEQANQAKSQFLAAASHDLRQPLHAMGLYAAALSLRARESEIKPLVASINASVEALESLFAQLLDLSRLEAGALQPRTGVVALDPLFARLAADFAPQAAASGLRFSIRPTRLAVVSDPVLLERVLRNLVSNALRYTHTGGVVVGARRRGPDARIDVVDTGVGIATADRERVFDDFVQVDGSSRHHIGGRGMGLGLAIVRRLAELLGHRLELASTIGRGSRFSIGIGRAPTPPVAAPPERRPAIDERSRSAPPLLGCRIAAIDDDPAVLGAVRALLEARGAKVLTGDSSAHIIAGMPAAGWDDVELVVADLRLAEGRSGVDEIGTLRRALGHPVPALVVSGDTADESRAEARRAGITLLQKPLVAEALEANVLALLAARAAHGETVG
jgi:signal transduction histidine kinase/CheY-like chemotaxis protein